MNLLHFIEEFPTERSCREHFRVQREQEGVICKGCGGTHHYWLNAKEQWQCATCGFRTTLKWVHIAISNAKRTPLGIYHSIKGKYLQNHLNEFCYKLNRR